MWVQISENIFSDVSKNVKFDEHLNNFCLFLDMYLDILDTLGFENSWRQGCLLDPYFGSTNFLSPKL